MAAAHGPESDDPFAHTRMTLGEHLDELRKRLFRGLVAVAVAFVAALFFRAEITHAVLRPHRQVVQRLNAHYLEEATAKAAERPELRERYFAPDGTFKMALDDRLVALTPTESMWFTLKVAGYAALCVGSPFLLWQLWQFVAAGLYPRERRWMAYFFPPALLLFLGGLAFSFFLLVPYGVFYLLADVSIDDVKPTIGLGFYFSFLTTMCLGMGAIFQLPVLMTFLALVGIVQVTTFTRMRGYAVIAAFVLAALLSPGPDVFSQVAMAAPILVLYEVGILGARLATRGSVRSA